MSKTTEKPRNGAILDYLRKIPIYPFDPKIDPDFVEELVTDFASVIDILEETKAFRWFIFQGTDLKEIPSSLLRHAQHTRCTVPYPLQRRDRQPREADRSDSRPPAQ